LYSEIMSSSSLSSSESDTGIYTNDEGREGNNTKYKLTNIKQTFMILSVMMWEVYTITISEFCPVHFSAILRHVYLILKLTLTFWWWLLCICNVQCNAQYT
jgi:hypothetical protein